MGNKFIKKKVFILSIVITFTILIFSIGFIGLMGLNKHENKVESAVAMEIKTAADLQSFASKVNSGTNFSGQTIKLANDIDCSDLTSFTPIGTPSKPFKGTFDGNKCKIIDIPLCRYKDSVYSFSGGATYYGYYYGFFGAISGATIKDVHIYNTNWTDTTTGEASRRGALLVAQATGGSTLTNILITKSSLTISWSTSSALVFEGYVGGLVGYVNFSDGQLQINNCAINANISTNKTRYAGGVVGGGVSGAIGVNNCYYNGNLSVVATSHLACGGISGIGLTEGKNNYVCITGGTLQSGYYSKLEGNTIGPGNGLKTYYYPADCQFYALAPTCTTYSNNKIFMDSSAKCIYLSGAKQRSASNLTSNNVKLSDKVTTTYSSTSSKLF